ncbi:MAG TPA: biotin-dependent carboxyltransferase family protein [Roseiarcus sp.]|jgi:allophanate hydrolase
MAAAGLVVSSVGPLVTIQDRGRPGLMRYGVPASGPMDRAAFEIANAALGNPSAAAAIEISMGGLALECVEGAVTVALAGGGFVTSIDRTRHDSWIVATIRAGSRLTVRPGPWGSWTYLAFAGTLKAKSWLGSCSTLAYANLGGGSLVAGQRLEVEDADIRDERVGEIPCPVWCRPHTDIKVVLGPQERFFAPEALENLLSLPFALTDAYDRMGVRLAGPMLPLNTAPDMPSEAISRGSIQVSGDGAATVLLSDHQTTGGYPKIATVVSDQWDGLAQLRSRSQITFASMDPAAAIACARTRHRLQQEFLANLRAKPATLAQRLMAANLIDGVVSGAERS